MDIGHRSRSTTTKSRALGALKLTSEMRDENVPAKQADFFIKIDVRHLIKKNLNALVHRSGGPGVKISLDHFDRADSPLCAYYVFIMVDYQERDGKTVGVV